MSAKNGSIKSNLRNKAALDFSKIGGLNEHIQLLREIIILPLVYADLYSHFNVKAPKGVLFYGPPGTGKTLVAGALANELSKEGHGKVQFFSRKGADVLDKYVGESERKLRELFEKAAKQRPSIIFFDELDGLAPPRSQRNDQVHSSIVATLLALMDGLNTMNGVIVIGATNRIDAIDPALRRPGRFDRELFFPIPRTAARKDILAVHVRTWPQKPNTECLSHLAQITAGYTGSDLQALCSEAFLCCVKRLYPSIYNVLAGNKVHIDKFQLKVEKRDFSAAQQNITTSTQRSPCKVKKMSEYIKPLLQRQLNQILSSLESIWPQFINPGQKLFRNVERNIGRVLLLGTPGKGLNLHIVPALLEAFEHLPIEVIEASSVTEKIIPTQYSTIASILLLSRVQDWWNLIEDSIRNSLYALLEDMHPSCPLLIICTCDCFTNLPENLQKYFSSNSALVVHIENPTKQEAEAFFRPLFFGKSIQSVQTVFQNTHFGVVDGKKQENTSDDDEDSSKVKRQRSTKTRYETATSRRKRHYCNITQHESSSSLDECPTYSKAKRVRYSESSSSVGSQTSVDSFTSKENIITPCRSSTEIIKICNTSSNLNHRSIDSENRKQGNILKNSSKCANVKGRSTSRIRRMSHSKSRSINRKTYTNFTTPLTDLVNTTYCNKNTESCRLNIKKTTIIAKENQDNLFAAERTAIQNLFNGVLHVISENYTVSQLELLYDTISACIHRNNNNFGNLVKALKIMLGNFNNYIR